MLLAAVAAVYAAAAFVSGQLLDAEVDGKAVLQAGLMDSSALISLAVVKAGDKIIGPIHYDFSMRRLDPIAMAQLMHAILQNSHGACHSAEHSQKRLTAIKGVLPALLQAKPEIHIDRLSVGYRCDEAIVTASLRLPDVTAADFDQPAALAAPINRLAMQAAQKQIDSSRQGLAAAASPAEQLAQAQTLAEGMVQLQLALANN